MDHATPDGKRRVAEALWRTIAERGIAGVSVRTVAAEAGVTGGTVQHHFPTRAAMLHYAMELIAAQVEERLLAVPRTGPASEWTRALLLELLPLDAARRREFWVWLSFTVHADTDRDLGELHRFTTARLRELYQRIIDARNGPGDRTDPEIEAALLHAFIDGLSLQLAGLTPAQAAQDGPRLLDAFLAK